MTDLRDIFQQGKSLESGRDWAKAALCYGAVIAAGEGALRIQAHRRRAECLMRRQQWAEARQDVDAVFAAGGPILNRDIKRRVAVFSHLGDYKQAAATIEAYTKHWLMENSQTRREGLTILTAAPPKSGSTSLAVALSAAGGWPKINFLCYQNGALTQGYPPMAALDLLRGVGIVNHCHLAPDRHVLDMLKARPWVGVAVHLRHPVEIILSTIDLILRQNPPLILDRAPHLVDASLGEITEWVTRVYAPSLANWVAGWLEIVDGNHPSILSMTTLSQMKSEGQDALAARILQSRGIVPIPGATSEPQGTGQRLSGPDRATLTPRQRDRVMAAFPVIVRQRFGWE